MKMVFVVLSLLCGMALGCASPSGLRAGKLPPERDMIAPKIVELQHNDRSKPKLITITEQAPARLAWDVKVRNPNPYDIWADVTVKMDIFCGVAEPVTLSLHLRAGEVATGHGVTHCSYPEQPIYAKTPAKCQTVTVSVNPFADGRKPLTIPTDVRATCVWIDGKPVSHKITAQADHVSPVSAKEE